MKKYKELLLVLIPLLIVGIALGLPISVEKSDSINIEGKIEISTRSYYTEVGGQIEELNLELGQRVSPGEVLAVIDSSEIEYQIKQLQVALEKAQAYVRDLEKPNTYPTQSQDIEIAKNSLALAEQSYKSLSLTKDKLQKDYASMKSLFQAGGASQQELDNLEKALKDSDLALESSQIQIATAKENLKKAQNQSSTDLSEKIKMAKLDIASIENQISHLKASLEKYTIKAIDSGIAVLVSSDQSALTMAGSKLFEISDEGSKEFVFYLPEEYIDYIEYAQEVTLTSKPKKGEEVQSYTGIINYIDLNSQYTPKEGESPENENKLSFKVKALIQGENNLKPSQKLNIAIG